MTLTERELLNVLERHGIKRVEPVHEPFNPHLHQAVMEIPRSDVPEGTIVQVFQSGFMIEDRVLRPAMVAVPRADRSCLLPDGSGPVTPPANENTRLSRRSGPYRMGSLFLGGEREQRIDQERSYHAAQCHDHVVMPREALPRGIGQFARSRNGIAGGAQSVQ